MSATIPRRIIQTWSGGIDDLPLKYRAAVANLKLLNPDFEYLFFDDQKVFEFVADKFPEYLALFRAFPRPIQRYDFFRYLAVYHFGGFYFDLDVFLARSLEDLLDSGCVFPFEEVTLSTFLSRDLGMDWQIGNYAFGAAAGHPFLHAVIRNCVRAQEDRSWAKPMWNDVPRVFHDEFHILNTTGPGLVSRTLAEYPEAASRVEVLFPEDVCDPDYWHRFGEFGIHLQDGSWRNSKGFLYRRLFWTWCGLRLKRQLRASRLRGKKRSLQVERPGMA
jgi:mannosyltransferase OCH1-like enzyme